MPLSESPAAAPSSPRRRTSRRRRRAGAGPAGEHGCRELARARCGRASQNWPAKSSPSSPGAGRARRAGGRELVARLRAVLELGRRAPSPGRAAARRRASANTSRSPSILPVDLGVRDRGRRRPRAPPGISAPSANFFDGHSTPRITNGASEAPGGRGRARRGRAGEAAVEARASSMSLFQPWTKTRTSGRARRRARLRAARRSRCDRRPRRPGELDLGVGRILGQSFFMVASSCSDRLDGAHQVDQAAALEVAVALRGRSRWRRRSPSRARAGR